MNKNSFDHQAERLKSSPGVYMGFLRAAGIALLYFFVARAGFFAAPLPEVIAWLWLPSGLALAVLMFNRHSNWAALLVLLFTANLGACLAASRPMPVSLGLSLAQSLQTWLAASLLTYYSKRISGADSSYHFHRLMNVLVFLGAVLFSAALGAPIAAYFMGANFWQNGLKWLLAESLGSILIFPLLCAWIPLRLTWRADRASLLRAAEAALLLACLALTIWASYIGDHPLLSDSILRNYLIFPFLIWAAARFDQRFVTLFLLFTGLSAVFGAMNGLGLFAGQADLSSARWLSAQLYLLLLLVSTLNLSAAITQTNLAGAAAARSEMEYRNLFEDAAIGIFHSQPGKGFLKVNPALARMLGYDSPQEMLATITNIPGQLYVDMYDYENLLEKIMHSDGWAYVTNRYLRKDGSLMLGRLSVRRVMGTDGSLAYLEGYVEDVTERMLADEALKSSAALLNESQAIARVGGWEYDCLTKKLAWTQEVYRIHELDLDYDPNNLDKDFEFYEAHDRHLLEKAFQDALTNGTDYDLELRFITACGRHLWVRTRGTVVLEDGRVVKLRGSIMDISERKIAQITLAANEEQLRLAMEASNDGMWDWRPQESLTYYSPAYYRQLGYTPDEFPETIEEWIALVHPDDQPMMRKANADLLENRAQNIEIEMRLWSKSNGWRWILSRGKIVSWDQYLKPLRVIGTHVDITERKRVEEALRRANRKLEKQAVANEAMHTLLIEQATHDALTGLYNRRFMDDALRREILRAHREGSVVSVLMLDIDHFKNFNDQYGHDAGDQVLVALSSLLRVNIRESDIACRYGGEEFIVILPGASAVDAGKRAELIREDFSNIRVAGGAVMATISVGVAEYPQHGVNVDELLRSADTALYYAKNSGRNQVSVY